MLGKGENKMSATTKNIWIVQYNHRYGVDTWPVLSAAEPQSKEIIKDLEDWEGDDRADEYIEIVGPFCLSSMKRITK